MKNTYLLVNLGSVALMVLGCESTEQYSPPVPYAVTAWEAPAITADESEHVKHLREKRASVQRILAIWERTANDHRRRGYYGPMLDEAQAQVSRRELELIDLDYEISTQIAKEEAEIEGSY